MINIAINGFGRIGRLVGRLISQNPNLKLAAINDLTDTKTLAHLFKFDSTHGIFNGNCSFNENHIIINNNEIKAFKEKDPSLLPWGNLNIDVVIECTGKFTEKDKALLHIQSGAKKVIISAPAKDDVKTIVLGVNDELIDPSDLILSNASCTTNCLAPMVKILDQLCGIEKGFMTTVHAYTADQNLQDAPHKDLRRARSAATNIVPTTTGAAKAVEIVLPHLKGKLNGNSMRVPVSDGSITDFTCIVKNIKTVEEVNLEFKRASENEYKNILEYTILPLVSSDIIGNPSSCIFDSELTMSIGNMVKIVGWYDNEFGYSSRLVDLVKKIYKL